MNRSDVVKQIVTDYEMTFSHTDTFGGKHYKGLTYSLHDCARFNYVQVFENNPYDSDGCRTGGITWEINIEKRMVDTYNGEGHRGPSRPFVKF